MRPIWKGALSFGLVHIPVRLYSASKERELSFKLLHKKDLSEIRYARICKADGKEIPWNDVVKGYEYKEGSYVVLTEEDFEKANPKKNRAIEILDFTPEEQVDTIYYDAPYYLEPEKGSAKAYALFCAALQKSKKIAIGRFVFHHHEYIGAIRVHENVLILHQLRYKSEIISPKELSIPNATVPKKELDVALKLIDQLTSPFQPGRYSDSYTDEIKDLIKKKAKGKKISTLPKTKTPSPKVHDIMDLLKSSLEEKKKKKRKIA
jgi:DNA end-binding protein Ku